MTASRSQSPTAERRYRTAGAMAVRRQGIRRAAQRWGGRRWRRTGAVAALALVLVLLWALPASAHAELVSTDPGRNATLDTAPSTVTLTFNEPVEVAVGAVRVLDARGNRVDRGRVEHPDGDPRSVRVSLVDGLSGGFAVGYRVTSADSHPVQGAFTFGVGGSGDDAARVAEELLAGEGGSQVVGAAFAVARWLVFGALILLVGSVWFLQRLWPAGRGQPAARRLLWGAWAALLAGTVASIGLQGAYAAGLPLLRAADPLLFADVLSTRFGLLALARIGLLILAIPLIAGLARAVRPAEGGAVVEAGEGEAKPPAGDAAKPAGEGAAKPAGQGAPAAAAQGARSNGWFTGLVDDIGLLLGVGLLLSVSLAGHAATGRLVPLAIGLDVAHLAAASLWLGGLAMLVVGVLPRRDPAELGSVVPRFSSAAFACVVVVAATGAVQGWRQLDSFDALFGSTYGQLLLTKVAGVALLVGIGAMSRRAVRRRLAPASARSLLPAGPGADRADQTAPEAARLRRLVGIEVGIAVVVLGLTSLLVNAVPARAGGEVSFGTVAPGSPTSGASGAQIAVGETTVVVLVDPARNGPNDLHFSIVDKSGQLVPVQGFSAELRLPSQGLGPIKLELFSLGPGHYAATGVQIPIKGTWQVTAKVRQSDIDEDAGVGDIQIK